MAILVGAGITAIIQSSSATTVMVVGFVNAGMLELTQAVGVIMGANIGTTDNRMDRIHERVGQRYEARIFCPLCLGIGAFLVLFTKSEKKEENRGKSWLASVFCLSAFLLCLMQSNPIVKPPVFCEGIRGTR